MYGRSRKGTRSYRGSGSRNYRKPYASMLKAAPYTGRRGTYKTGLKFATVGFTRDVEKKYCDKALTTTSFDMQHAGHGTGLSVTNGFMWSSAGWAPYDFQSPMAATTATTNDLLKGVTQGTTTTTRIGNKIRGRYIKGAMTLGSAKLAGPSSGASNGDMNGEAVSTAANATTIWQFMRTTWRVVIVKDLQVNSADTHIVWNDVFESDTGSVGQTGGVHAELKIANMGRFKVLSDKYYKTDAVCPQETVSFMISGKDIGNVRYNGPGSGALTDKGIYIIWAAYTSGNSAQPFDVTEGLAAPTFTMHSRLAFTDD